ncbi:hypothetical protein BCR32DRAFT_282648 [Anaeromyces robustus]|uniref:Uncharacterized protein n=1 Tax=Anaeromyces robustus TaxID=1754192 RepID=A0A1Y1WWZ2_9FUNG|nr:hypothetical protein BCR32DRAFT_282648 [Anaeromyces robustus]|eukprot:ORX78033.1 hypothetical protein BCR32DRAFT_282648 [Anaeromyces robustus]
MKKLYQLANTIKLYQSYFLDNEPYMIKEDGITIKIENDLSKILQRKQKFVDDCEDMYANWATEYKLSENYNNNNNENEQFKSFLPNVFTSHVNFVNYIYENKEKIIDKAVESELVELRESYNAAKNQGEDLNKVVDRYTKYGSTKSG